MTTGKTIALTIWTFVGFAVLKVRFQAQRGVPWAPLMGATLGTLLPRWLGVRLQALEGGDPIRGGGHWWGVWACLLWASPWEVSCQQSHTSALPNYSSLGIIITKGRQLIKLGSKKKKWKSWAKSVLDCQGIWSEKKSEAHQKSVWAERKQLMVLWGGRGGGASDLLGGQEGHRASEWSYSATGGVSQDWGCRWSITQKGCVNKGETCPVINAVSGSLKSVTI